MLFLYEKNQADAIEAFNGIMIRLRDCLKCEQNRCLYTQYITVFGKGSKYDQEMPQSYTADKPTAA